jgi:lipopolysaccharide heptosyltransferase I
LGFGAQGRLRSPGSGAQASILIVKLGSLGDIIHAIPAAAAIRRAFPQARIDWLADARHRELIDLVEVVDRRILIDTSALASVLEVVRELRRESYDAALDLQGLLKSAVLARLSGASRVVGFPQELLRERAAGMFYKERAGESTPHVIEKNLSMLTALGIRMPEVEFPLDDCNPRAVEDARSRLGVSEGTRFALINPGAAWPNKRWPPVYFAEVARALSARYGLRSLVLWGPGEEQIAHDIVAAADGSAAVSPPTRIADLVSLAKSAALMISGDTGPMHIAGAVGTPIIGIFGPTDPNRNGPWGERDLTASRYRACVCHYQRQCRISGWCLLDIAPREVMELVEKRLAAHA